jgi:hypothetical protein
MKSYFSQVKSWLQKIQRSDENLSLKLFENAKSNKVIGIMADIISLSSDELIWFGLPSFIGCLLFCVRLCGFLRPIGCLEEAAFDCFGSSAVCTFFESILKWTFQRTRPKYTKQAEWYSISGEWFSFPSGHSLRAFYLLFWLSRSKFVLLLHPWIHFPNATHLIPWAILVGWSRVAKGRHFFADVCVGAVVGLIAGYFVEDYYSGYGRTVMKTVGGIYTVLCWGYLVVIPFVAGNHDVRKRAAVGILFYLYAIMLLLDTLPETVHIAGSQTIAHRDDAIGTTCQRLW